MGTDVFQRARRPEQKEERKALLLGTARELLLQHRDCAELSLNALARHAGMAKSNVYRYFESREAVLLAVLVEEWTGFGEEIVADLSGDEAPLSLEELGGAIVGSLAKRPLLCHLMSVLPSVLEKNLSVNAIRAFKLESLEFLNGFAELCANRCPTLNRSQHLELIRGMTSAQCALWQFSNPPPHVSEAISIPELETFRHDFEKDLLRHYVLLGAGIVATA